MRAVLEKTSRLLGRRVTMTCKEPTQPESLYKERPMTGLLAHMSDEQKRRAREYAGPINHGDPSFAN